MNKIYRVIWNKETGTWNAVSEYAKAKGKSSSSAGAGGVFSGMVFTAVRFAYTMVMSGLLIATGQVAYAATVADGTGLNAIVIQGASSTATATGADSLAAGTNAAADGTSALAIGTNVTAGGLNSIAIGGSNNVTGGYTTVIGSDNIPKDGKGVDANGDIVDVTAAGTITATHSSIIGTSNKIAVSSVIGTPPPYAGALTDVQVQGNKNTINRGRAYVFGSENTINTNASNMGLEPVVAVGYQNTVSGNNSLAVGRLNTVAGGSALAVGINSQALGTDGIAIGNKAYANRGENAVALGGLTHAGQFGTALGARTSVEGDQGAAVATGAVVKGARAVAVGSYSFAGTEDAVALGHNTAATGPRAVAMGAGSVVSGARSGAWGIATNGGQPQNNTTDRSFVGGTDSYAIGNKNIIGDKSSDSFVLGNNVKLGATGASIAITNVANRDGTTNASTRTNAVTYTGATAITGAVALGSDTSVTVDNGVALGKGSVASTAAGQAGTDPLSAKDATASAGVWTATHAAVSVGNGTTVTRQITSVAAGTQDTDAVNVAQLKAAGFTLKATSSTGGEATTVANDKIQNGETVTVDAGKNIKVTHAANQVSIATKDDVSFNSVTAGTGTNAVVLDDKGVNVGGKTYISNAGLDANGKKVTNVADGIIGKDSKDAINGGQLFAQGEGVKNIIGGSTTYDPTTGTYINNNIGGTGKGNINDAIQTVNTKADTNATEIAKGLNFGANDQTATSNTAINRKLGETIGIKGGITDTTIATSGENVITRTDANGNINIELAKNAKFDSVTTGGTKLSDAGLSFVDASGSPVANSPSISKTGINAGNQKITNVGAGSIGAGSTDAVNGSQIHDLVGSTAYVDGNGVTQTTVQNIGGTGANNINDAIQSVNDTANAGWNVTTNGDALTTANVAPKGTVDFDNTDGNIVIGQSGTDLTFDLAKNIAVDSITAGNSKLDTNGLTVTDTNGSTVIGSTGLSFVNAAGTTTGPSITANGIDAGNQKITNVGAGSIGAGSTDAVNGSQIHDLVGSTAYVDGNGVTQTTVQNIGGTGATNINDAIQNINDAAANANAGWNVSTSGGTASNVKPGDTVDFSGDGNVVVSNDGNKVTVGLADNVTIGSGVNAVNIDGENGKVNVGDSTLNSDGLTIAGGPSVTKDGIDAAGNKVTNVGDGKIETGSKDAVNGGQIADIVSNINTDIANATAAATSKVEAGDNISVSETKNTDGSTTYNVATKKDVTFDKVTSGSVIADKVTVGKVVIDQAGINAGGNKVTNVADGAISSTSKDAINGSQLHASNTNIYNYLGGGANYETNTGPTYNVGGGSHNNVGDALTALDDRDNQLDNKITNLGDQLQQAFYTTNERIDDVEKRANAGIAAAMALETAPYVAGKWTYAAAASYHGGENAVGVTFRKTADNGRWSLTSGIAAASQGDPSFRIGISGVID